MSRKNRFNVNQYAEGITKGNEKIIILAMMLLLFLGIVFLLIKIFWLNNTDSDQNEDIFSSGYNIFDNIEFGDSKHNIAEIQHYITEIDSLTTSDSIDVDKYNSLKEKFYKNEKN